MRVRAGVGIIDYRGEVPDDQARSALPSGVRPFFLQVTHKPAYADADGVMNLSVADIGGEILAVSQFTLYALTRKGNRPSWGRAARGDISEPRFDQFVARLSAALGRTVPTGVFGADMQVSLVNDGPVTIAIDSRNPE